MTTHVATPYGPPVPGNPVYVAMPIVPGAWVVAYAPVFAYQSTADPSVYKVASGWTSGTSAVTAKWQLEGFVGIATMTAKGPTSLAGGQSSKRRKTDEANSCTVQVAGSVSVMVPKSQSQTPTPGRWCMAVPTGLSTWDGQSQPVQVATVREAAASTGSAIGVCLAVAPDKCSITLLLRRDAYQSVWHSTATRQSRTVAGQLVSSGPGETVTLQQITAIAFAVVHCTTELATLDKINTMLKEEATALEASITTKLDPAARPAAEVKLMGFKNYSTAVDTTYTQLTKAPSASDYLAGFKAAAEAVGIRDPDFLKTGIAMLAASNTARAALKKKAGSLPNLVRVLTDVVASTATDHHLPMLSQLTALKDTW